MAFLTLGWGWWVAHEILVTAQRTNSPFPWACQLYGNTHRLYERINYGTFLIWIKSQWKHNDKYIWAQKAISCSLEPSYIIQALTRRDRQTGHRFTTPRAVIHVTRLYLKYKHKRIISLSPGSECLSDAQCLCQNPLMPHLTPLCQIFDVMCDSVANHWWLEQV